MKHHSFLLPFILFILACSPTHRDAEWLRQAEAHYNAGQTDSVLTYLYKINENQLTEEELRTFQRVKFATIIQTEPESIKQMKELAAYYLQQKDTIHLQTMRKILYRDYKFREKVVRGYIFPLHVLSGCLYHLQGFVVLTLCGIKLEVIGREMV